MPFYPIESTQNQGGIVTQQIFPTIVFSIGGDWVTTPSNLTNITDGNDSTGTTQGELYGYSRRFGSINLDLAQEISWMHSIFKVGVQKSSGYNNQPGYWGIDYSLNNLNWTTCYGLIDKTFSDSSESIISHNFTIKDTARYLRFWTQDLGSGGNKLRIYDLKLYTLA